MPAETCERKDLIWQRSQMEGVPEKLSTHHIESSRASMDTLLSQMEGKDLYRMENVEGPFLRVCTVSRNC